MRSAVVGVLVITGPPTPYALAPFSKLVLLQLQAGRGPIN